MSAQTLPTPILPPIPRHHEPRYATPDEQARLRRIVGWCVDDAGGAEGIDRRNLIDQYAYLLRIALNSMLRDRRNTYL